MPNRFNEAFFDEKTNRRNSGSEKYEPLPPDEKGREVIPMWVADMDFKTLPAAIEAMRKTVANGIFGYTLDGDDYAEKVRGWYAERMGWNFDKKSVMNAPGVIYGIAAGVRMLTSPGDGVLIFEPVYAPFGSTIAANGRKVVVSELINTDGYYTINFDDLEKKLASGEAKAILFCSPHNPVGRVWTRAELLRIAELCVKYDISVISDEIHSDFILTERRHIPLASLEGMENRVITCTAPTKTFNLAGVKGANMIINSPELRIKFSHEREMTGNADLNVFSITATKTVYGEGAEWVDGLVSYIRGNMDILKKAFPLTGTAPDAPVTMNAPEGTYLAWLDCRELVKRYGIDSPAKFFQRKAGVRMNDGKWFGKGGDGFVRINLATQRDVVKEAVTRMKDAIAELETN